MFFGKLCTRTKWMTPPPGKNYSYVFLSRSLRLEINVKAVSNNRCFQNLLNFPEHISQVGILIKINLIWDAFFRNFWNFWSSHVPEHTWCTPQNTVTSCYFLVQKFETRRLDEISVFYPVTSITYHILTKTFLLSLSCIMSQNGQTHFRTLAGIAARFLKCGWSFWDVMH